MFPSDLEKFKESETFAHAFSVEVGSPEGRSVPLFTLEGRLSLCKKVCDGISDDALKSWLNPPEGQLGHPNGTWAAQLAEVGRQQVEMQKRINRLLWIAKTFRSRIGGATWTLDEDERELALSVERAIAEAEAA